MSYASATAPTPLARYAALASGSAAIAAALWTFVTAIFILG